MDSTESRYAEIARKMLETGDWLMPQFDYGVPFWGKPPLSTWLSAASMAVFGVNEFAARLPSLALLVGLRRARLRARRAARRTATRRCGPLALFAATGLVFVAAGAMMTDPALMLGTTLSMAGFWIAVNGPERHRRIAGCAFFAGLCVGLLAKGPVAAVLVLVPIGASTLWTRRGAARGAACPGSAGRCLRSRRRRLVLGRRAGDARLSRVLPRSASTGSASSSRDGPATSTAPRMRGHAG